MTSFKFQAIVSGPGYGYVYVMSYPGDNKLKIGHSLDPFDRAKDIGGTKAPLEPVVEAFFWCSERREAVERASHRLENSARQNGEWFDISIERALEAIRSAARLENVEVQLVYDRNEITKLALAKEKIQRQAMLKVEEAQRQESLRVAAKRKAEDEAKEAYAKHLAALQPKCMNCALPLVDVINTGGSWVRCRKCGYNQIKR